MAVDPIIEALVSKQPWYVCLRKHTLNAHDTIRGEVVNVEGVPASVLNSLVERRYLYMLPYGLNPPPAVEGPDGVERRMLPGHKAPEALQEEAA